MNGILDTYRIEEASLNAWPAMRQTLLDGWILRFSRGFTKRSNSIIPLYLPINPGTPSTSQSHIVDKIRYCENLYAREQLQTVFRLTSIPSDPIRELQALLRSRGYREVDPSLVLATPLEKSLGPTDQSLSWVPIDQWLDAYCGLTEMTEPVRTLHKLILSSITPECGFAVLKRGKTPVACGLAVVEHQLVGLFDVFVSPNHRRQGFGDTLVRGLLNWGYQQGATAAYLQVVANNEPAKQLYEDLGFIEKYRYWYEIAP